MQLCVRVMPNSKKFAVGFRNGKMTIHATEEPERGKVNAEIVKQLEKMLKCRVRIIRGHTSRNKLLEIDSEEQKVWDAIANCEAKD